MPILPFNLLTYFPVEKFETIFNMFNSINVLRDIQYKKKSSVKY